MGGGNKGADTLKKKKGASKAQGTGPPRVAFRLSQGCGKGCLKYTLRLPDLKGHQRSGVPDAFGSHS